MITIQTNPRLINAVVTCGNNTNNIILTGEYHTHKKQTFYHGRWEKSESHPNGGEAILCPQEKITVWWKKNQHE